MTLKDFKCLAIIGRAGSGKDTLAQYICEYIYGTDYVKLDQLKFSETLKRAVCEIFGWDFEKLNELAYKEEELHKPLRVWKYRPRVNDNLYEEVPYNLFTRRDVLQYIGTDVFRKLHEDVWVEAALREADEVAKCCEIDGFISTDCRFPNEQKGLVEAFGKTLFVRLHRSGERQDSYHASEDIDKLYADMEFRVQSGDLNRLREIARLVANDFFPELVKENV